MKYSESLFLDKLKKHLSAYGNDVIVGIGDDAAVIRQTDGRYLLASCDVQVEGTHFLRDMSPSRIGQKAVIASISDIAAMGGMPTYVLVSLVIPIHLGGVVKRHPRGGQVDSSGVNFIDELYKGIRAVCGKYNITIVGGNISRGKQVVIDIFVLGTVAPQELLLRSGAKPGDAVLVTGKLGKLTAPLARVEEGRTIAKSGLATAMIDVSDGLSTDLLHICDASGVGVRIFEEKLPTAEDLRKALNGGEDYELCFTTPQKNSKALIERVKRETGTDVKVIGKILPKREGRWVVDGRGKRERLESKGWDHLR